MNDNNDTSFFEENKPAEETVPEEAPVEKIKVGDTEYTQEELSQFVGLGKQVKEINQQYNTDLFKVWPEYTKTTQKLKTAEERLKALENQPSLNANGEIDQNAAAQAKQVLKQLGYMSMDDLKAAGFVSREEARQEVQDILAARDLISNTDSVISGYVAKGLPKIDKGDLLKYMAENGFKSPDKAYKDKFEKEVDSWKENQISQARRPGIYTQQQSGATRKQPTEVKPRSEEDLHKVVTEFLNKAEV